jgi:hypothetical protein
MNFSNLLKNALLSTLICVPALAMDANQVLQNPAYQNLAALLNQAQQAELAQAIQAIDFNDPAVVAEFQDFLALGQQDQLNFIRDMLAEEDAADAAAQAPVAAAAPVAAHRAHHAPAAPANLAQNPFGVHSMRGVFGPHAYK